MTLKKQLALEREMLDKGASKYWKDTNKSLQNGRLSDTTPGVFLVKKAIEPLSKSIKAFLYEANMGKPGPRQVAAVYLDKLSSDVSAFLTVKTSLNSCIYEKDSSYRGYQSLRKLSIQVGGAIEDELRCRSFEEQNNGLYKFMLNKLNEEGATPAHQRKVLFHTMSKASIDWESWTVTEKIHIGTKLVELLQQSTGIIGFDYGYKSRISGGLRKTGWSVYITDKIKDWFDDQIVRCEFFSPYKLPMVSPPAPWSTLDNGGYYLAQLKQPIVTKLSKEHREVLEKADLTQVYKGLNVIQDTPFRINTPVLEVAQAYAENGVEVKGLEFLPDLPIPMKPHDIETNEESRKLWKGAAKETHVKNHKRRADRLRYGSILDIADKFKEEQEIFFPHCLDFRGREYPISTGLHPQGSDLVKSLLKFANPKPLETQEAVKWLSIQGANSWGEDKVSLEDRCKWVEKNSDLICENANDPFSNRWWTEADKPWCFLAFCFEWEGYCRNGLEHLSTLVIAQDGSCNGLQHFSAILKDKEGGQAVNLLPSQVPNDIYGTVASKTEDNLRGLIKTEDDVKTKMWLETWLSFGIDRTITKRPVMVLPYGGTIQSCLSYVKDAVNKKAEKTGNPFGSDLSQASTSLAKIVWKSINQTIVSARGVMTWLQTISKATTDAGLPLKWETPTGFIAYQDYKNLKKKKVKTKFQGSVIQLSDFRVTDKTDKAKQSLAISPNFIHSLDAAMLFLTVNRLSDKGIKDFSMVHDSYGTHASDAPEMARVLREVFIELYSEDVLGNLRSQIIGYLPEEYHELIPDTPMTGTLDINEVRKSDFFFS